MTDRKSELTPEREADIRFVITFPYQIRSELYGIDSQRVLLTEIDALRAELARARATTACVVCTDCGTILGTGFYEHGGPDRLPLDGPLCFACLTCRKDARAASRAATSDAAESSDG